MIPFKILEHTADMRIRVQGHTEEEVFQSAALALAAILYPEYEKFKKRPGEYEKIVIEAPDINILLVNFLNEVLSRSEINKKIYPRIKFLKFSPKSLETQIFGFPIDYFDEDIKAVTYHEAEIEQNKRGIFEVILTLDI